MDVFSRYAPFIQDFIYASGWSELRGIQVAAAEVLFETQDNLLLSSGTASGKTEAAFLPILTDLVENPSVSVGALYISPLKALINDQFVRLEQLLVDSGLTVTKWHGDASESKKNSLVKHPSGILQITPESLENLLTRKRGACLRLFSDLRYVIIDEVHHFMRDQRGTQVLCLLERLQRLCGVNPRRVGLSATLGDIEAAKAWLGSGTDRECAAPVTDEGKKSVRLFVQRFEKAHDADGTHADSGDRAHFEYLFRNTLDKKTIIFTNSREETEFVIANLREIARRNKAPDVYRVHHGNISALLRERTEEEMKLSDDRIVTGATVTLELGIDIGSLDQVVQIGAPITVSSFAQRLGRCGRRGQVPQLLFTFVEEVEATAAESLGPVNWAFVRLLAIIELYTKDRWIEPIAPQTLPYPLLYHQTLSHLKSCGELSPAKLAQDVLTLSPFSKIPQQDYRDLLGYLLHTEHLEKTEQGGLIIGRAAEPVVNHFQFCTVFIVPEYFLVKEENRSIGTVDKIYPEGMRFSLAGITWETLEVNRKARVIFVRRVPGISVVDWDVDFESELHTVLVRRMRSILLRDDIYAYLSENSRERLREIRCLTRNSGILEHMVTPMSENKYAVFPWVGTRQLFALHYALLGRGIKSRMNARTAVWLEVLYRDGAAGLEQEIADILESDIDPGTLPLPDDARIAAKYAEFIPAPLLRKQFICDFLDFKGLKEDLKTAKS